MHSVRFYMCDAKFTGQTSVSYARAPEVGSQHRCILFVRDDADDARVTQIMKDLGWEAIKLASRPLEPESLNEPSMQPFHTHYDACLKDGHSLVWYS
jgi:hypothetical protein